MNADDERALLIDALAAGEATPAQRARWECLGGDDPAVRDQVALAVRLRALLAPPDAALADRVLAIAASDEPAARAGTIAGIDRRLGSRARLRPVRRRPIVLQPLWWAVAAGLLLSTALLAWRWSSSAPGTPPQDYARVERLDATALVQVDGRDVVAGRTTLAAGAHLAVRNGRAALRFADGTTIDLMTDASLVAGPDAPGRSIVLEAGTVTATVASQPAERPLRIRTPQGEVTVVGTIFDLAVDAEWTRIAMFSGRVRLAGVDGVGAIPVVAGQRAAVRRGGLPQLEEDGSVRMPMAAPGVAGPGSAPTSRSVRIGPSADGYAWIAKPRAVTGHETLLAVKKADGTDRAKTREIFLRFPVTWRGPVERAVLHLEVITPGEPTRHALLAAIGAWDEDGLCWDVRPAVQEPPVATWPVTAPGPIAIDVTRAVRDQRGDTIDWCIRGTAQVGPDGMCAYGSREHGRSGARPWLEVTVRDGE